MDVLLLQSGASWKDTFIEKFCFQVMKVLSAGLAGRMVMADAKTPVTVEIIPCGCLSAKKCQYCWQNFHFTGEVR